MGLDLLADRYRDLGIDEHAMEYCLASADNIPLLDGAFDIVNSLNSLDYVDATLGEITRALIPWWLVHP